MVLLIHPPVMKPCEPPGGLLHLAGALEAAGVPFRVLDASLEGILFLLLSSDGHDKNDTWTRRAISHRDRHLCALHAMDTYGDLPRYRRAVSDLGRILKKRSAPYRATVGLADYRDDLYRAVSVADLLIAAENPEKNPFFPYYERRLEQIFGEREPEIIGVSLNYLSQAICSFALMGFIKMRLPRVRLVLGGSLVTSWHRRLGKKNPFAGLVDDLVYGPGEEVLLEMVGKKGKGQIISFPYEAFPLRDYLSPCLVMPIILSRGCYYGRCMFCPEREEKMPYRPLPFPVVEERLKWACSGEKLVHFLDCTLSPRLLSYLVDLSPGVPWYGFARFTEELTDESFTRALRKSGCVMLKLGVESGSQMVLDRMEKGIDLKVVSQALKSLTRAGIATYVYLLFGTPEEGETEARETLSFIAEHANFVSFLNLAVFNLPVGSRPDLICRPFYPGDLSLYEDFEHPKGWSRRRVRSFLEQEFKRQAPIRQILLRTPPVFTSNHAPFFHLRAMEGAHKGMNSFVIQAS